jgi:four helix bundle protein
MHQYGFEKLSVWQNARELLKKIYELTQKFPAEEKFVFVTQIRRSALSISSNIAEGSSRLTIKDQAHFYNTAYSSTIELINQIIIAADLGFISSEQYKQIRTDLELITNQINALRNSLSKTK